MSLFGAKKQTPPLRDSLLKKAKENFEKRMEEQSPSEASAVSSSHIDTQLDKITGPLSDLDGTAMTLEISHELSELACEDQQRQFFGTPEYEQLRAGEKQDEHEYGLYQARIEDDLKRCKNSNATSRAETVQLPSDLNDMRAYFDLTGKTGVTGITRYGSDDSAELSPPPTTDYGEDEVSFPSRMQSMKYEGSVLAFPPSALPQDAFLTPRVSTGIISQKYLLAEENVSQHVGKKEEEEGMGKTWKVYTPIQTKFDISGSSENKDDMMTELGWRDEEPYLMPTKKGKKHNKGKGVKRQVTPKRPIPNMPQTPTRRKLKADWAKPAEVVMNKKEPGTLEPFIGEYLTNTDGLRDFTLAKEKYYNHYSDW